MRRLEYTPDIMSTSFDLVEKQWLCLQVLPCVVASLHERRKGAGSYICILITSL